MGLSRMTLRELRSELAKLQRIRSEVDVQIQALELFLSPRAGINGEVRKDPRPRTSPVELVMVAPRRFGTNGSLRSRITDLLQQAPGLKTSELADRLLQDGFQVGGATSLRERVSHEVSRLKRLRLVRRGRGGRYTLALATANDRTGRPPRAAATDAPA